MIDFFLALLRESPILFMILIVNIVIVGYILFRLWIYFSAKKKPKTAISNLFWKLKAKKTVKDIDTVEDAYAFVMDEAMKSVGIGKEKPTFRARRYLIEKLPDEEKKVILKELFGLYEAKVYGFEVIRNEKKIVSDILVRYANL